MPNEASVERRLAAILAADVVGYSRLMGMDEVGTLTALKAIRQELANPAIASHHGRVVNTTGDGILIEFASVVDAVTCAVHIQRGMVIRNAEVPEDKRLVFRIGINVGDIIIDEADIHGDGVNIAARLEALAEPGGICVSRKVRDEVRDKFDLAFHDMGEKNLKNIARPVRAFGLSLKDISGLPDRDAALSAVSMGAKPAEPKPLALPDKPSLAVLPFQNMSGDPEQEYFADGMVEEITAALSRVRSFFVIARNSSFAYKGKAVDVKQVGRELGVRYVLEGSVRKATERVRITCQLIEASTNHHVWADRFEGTWENIFDLQDRVAESVVGAITPSLQMAEVERATLKPTENLAAYDLYLRSLPNRYAETKEGNDAALKLLYQAIGIEPTYSLAKAMAAVCYNVRCSQLWATEDERTEGIRLAREALNSHRDDPTTLGLAGHAIGYLSHEHDLARHASDRAIALNPNSAANFMRRGLQEMWLGNLDAAEDAIRRAMRLSPLDPQMGWMLVTLSNTHTKAGRLEEGLAVGLAAIREMPTAVQSFATVIVCLVGLGRLEEARQYGARLLQASPNFTIEKYLRTSASLRNTMKRYAEAFRLAGLPE